jgi:hypothetical protein
LYFLLSLLSNYNRLVGSQRYFIRVNALLIIPTIKATSVLLKNLRSLLGFITQFWL